MAPMTELVVFALWLMRPSTQFHCAAAQVACSAPAIHHSDFGDFDVVRARLLAVLAPLRPGEDFGDHLLAVALLHVRCRG